MNIKSRSQCNFPDKFSKCCSFRRSIKTRIVGNLYSVNQACQKRRAYSSNMTRLPLHQTSVIKVTSVFKFKKAVYNVPKLTKRFWIKHLIPKYWLRLLQSDKNDEFVTESTNVLSVVEFIFLEASNKASKNVVFIGFILRVYEIQNCYLFTYKFWQ